MSKERREKRDQKRQELLQQEFANQERLYRATMRKPLTRAIDQALKQGRR